jgi:excisionase family DNA binding protein
MNSILLKAKDVAESLNISRSQAFALMRDGSLPTIRFGRCVRVRPQDLEQFILRNITDKTDENLKAELAAVTASQEKILVNQRDRKVSHGR